MLLLCLVYRYDEFRDDTFKATYLPYPAARRVFAEAESASQGRSRHGGEAFRRRYAAGHRQGPMAQTTLDRNIAAVRVIEALRMHTAAHGGELPDKLSDATESPIPDDPGTGKPFEYQSDGESATLISRIPGEEIAKTGLRYRLVMKKK